MIIDDRRLAKLKTILKEHGIDYEDNQLENIGIDIARLVLISELLKQQKNKVTTHEL